MATATRAKPKATGRKLPPRAFMVGPELVSWAKLEVGFYYARFKTQGKTWTLIARLPDARATFTGETVIDETGLDLLACAERAVVRFREASGVAESKPATLYIVDAALEKTFKAVAKAVAREKSRFAFNAVRHEANRLVACDGKRMHVAEVSATVEGEPLMLPLQALSCFKTGAEVGRSGDTLSVGGWNGKPQEGAFPRYESVIPKDCPSAFAANRDALIAAIRQAAKLTNEQARSVRFSLKAGTLHLTARTMDVGEVETSIPVRQVGPDVSFAFNPDFILDAIKFVSDEAEVRFGLSGTTTPARLESDDYPDRCAVVMPVTVPVTKKA